MFLFNYLGISSHGLGVIGEYLTLTTARGVAQDLVPWEPRFCPHLWPICYVCCINFASIKRIPGLQGRLGSSLLGSDQVKNEILSNMPIQWA